jgi:hypothetical protein
MPYTRLDDNYPDHPKNRRLSHGAWRLHTTAIIYANRLRTDGHIDVDLVPMLMPKFRAAFVTELLESGHWAANGDNDYIIREYLDWNESRAEIEARSTAAVKAANARWKK